MLGGGNQWPTLLRKRAIVNHREKYQNLRKPFCTPTASLQRTVSISFSAEGRFPTAPLERAVSNSSSAKGSFFKGALYNSSSGEGGFQQLLCRGQFP